MAGACASPCQPIQQSADIEKGQAGLNRTMDVWMIRTLVLSRPDAPSAYYAAQFLGGFFHLTINKHVAPMFRSYLHLRLHLLVPVAVAAIFSCQKLLSAWITMTATMLVDLDHLRANPVYDPGRCSIGFHPRHLYPAIVAYGILLVWPRLRLIAIGLLTHMVLNGLDCFWMQYEA